jgi:hypothetical protein
MQALSLQCGLSQSLDTELSQKNCHANVTWALSSIPRGIPAFFQNHMNR